jgi:opacity protein-like surface antigen
MFLFSSCSFAPFIRAEYGPGTPFAVGKLINDDSVGYRDDGRAKAGLPMDGHYLSLKFGVQQEIFPDFNFDIAAGPTTWIPTSGPNGEYYSADAVGRVSYLGIKYFQPYAEGLLGVGRLEHHWIGEATKHQFSSGGGLGIIVPIEDHWKLSFGYRVYHISNGSAIFGTKRPNVGYNTDLFLFGFQYDF